MTFNVHGHKMQAAGWPDLQIYHPVFTGHIELKIRRNQCSELQQERIKMLKLLGTAAFVLRLDPFNDKVLRMENEGCLMFAMSDPVIIKWRTDGDLLLRWFANMRVPRT